MRQLQQQQFFGILPLQYKHIVGAVQVNFVLQKMTLS
jgi:hypothetical protein